ncbi:MAG: Sb-PDE family phosphodiesterase [Saprospiraceae bacterium]
MRSIFIPFLTLLTFNVLMAQEHAHNHGRKIEFPDVPGYHTLKCDFHIHTVFSDGNVWPTIRVEEAVKDGLDAISLTEHIEYQPHKQDIPHPDRNRSYEIVKDLANVYDLMIIHGTEITRDMPPGHSNAIFIKDVNAIKVDDPVEAFREAKRQGAFIFWNHPNWIRQVPDGKAKLTDLHRQLIREKLLDGIEVVNDITYSQEALQIALDNQLTVMGTSDIHGLVDWQFQIPQGGHRPITLVLTEERTPESLREGLEAHRTIAYFNDLLAGYQEPLEMLLKSCLVVGKATYEGASSVVEVQLSNEGDAPLILQNKSPFSFHAHADLVTIPPHDSIKLEVKTGQQLRDFELTFAVLNAVYAPDKHPLLSWNVVVTP